MFMKQMFYLVQIIILIVVMIDLVSFSHSVKKSSEYVFILEIMTALCLYGSCFVYGAIAPDEAECGYLLILTGENLLQIILCIFIAKWCGVNKKGNKYLMTVGVLIALDTISILTNPVHKNVFIVQELQVGSTPPYKIVLQDAYMLHICVSTIVMAVTISPLVYRVVAEPKIYKSKYAVVMFPVLMTPPLQIMCLKLNMTEWLPAGYTVIVLLLKYFVTRYKPVRLLNELLANITNESPDAIILFDNNDQCVWINNEGLNLLGTDDDRKVKRQLSRLFPGVNITGKDYTSGCVKTDSIDGKTRYYSFDRRQVRTDNGISNGARFRIRDITEERTLYEKQQYELSHDQLTGVFSRRHLFKKMEETINEGRGQSYVVIIYDIIDFKMINETYGNSTGDRVLIEFAKWLTDNTDENGLIGRINGDTFGQCIKKDVFDKEKLERSLNKIVIRVNGFNKHLTVHAGIYELTEEDTENLNIPVLFDRARIALASIKVDYQKTIAVYDKTIKESVVWNQNITDGLKKALKENQIVPYYQPIVDTKNTVIGVEALVRWQHPEFGFLTPDRFVPQFEKNGMIVDVDRYMWRQACKALQDWNHQDPDFFVSVNISPIDFFYIDVAETIELITAEMNIDPKNLRLEITETAMMTDVKNKIKILNRLREHGFLIEMDDFGSGYSSLNMLKDMPVDILKIDMMFLNSEQSANKQRANIIIKNIIKLSEQLDIKSLTEGVETTEQYDSLIEMGCNYFQGYLFSKPIPKEDVVPHQKYM